MTPLTSATSYATARQLTQLVDWRVVADCVSDNPARVSRRAVRDATHPAGAVVAQLLLQATGSVLQTAQAGGKYTPADLAALTGAGQAALVGLVCGTALLLAVGRRAPTADLLKRVPLAQEAKETLTAIRKGELVFGLLEPTEAAGMEASELYSETQTGGRVVSNAHRFFGNRGNQ